jgi:hypothetical protein
MRSVTIQTTLDKTLLSLRKLKNFWGKKVIITVIEVPEEKSGQKRIWNHLGDLHLDQQVDHINLRDFAHD